MEKISISLLLCLLVLQFVRPHNEPENKRFQSSYSSMIPVPKLIEYDGYPSEVHRIKTKDGYILDLHRIPYGRVNATNTTTSDNTTSAARPVALLVHCIFCTSSIWVIQGPEDGLGYMLADSGYDVWMLNTRGSQHSKRHSKYSSASKHYWEFSWHEMAVFDLPVTINYILGITAEKQLDYIGYSMGATIIFALLSQKPQYNNKIRRMMALAPAVYLTNSKGVLLEMATYVDYLEQFFLELQQYEIPPDYLNVKENLRRICNYKNIFLRYSCDQFFRLGVGSSIRNFDLVSGENCNLNLLKYRILNERSFLQKKMQFYFTYFPDTTSLRTISHYYQVRNSGQFSMYSYGKKMNLKVYGSESPPKYNLTQVTVPVYLFYGKDDTVTTPIDVNRLRSELPNVQRSFKITVPNFSHADFGWAKDVRKVVYDRVLQALLH